MSYCAILLLKRWTIYQELALLRSGVKREGHRSYLVRPLLPSHETCEAFPCQNKHFHEGECIPSTSPSAKDTLLLRTGSTLHFNSSIPASSLSTCLSKGSMGIPRISFLPPCPPLQGGQGGKTHSPQSTGSL